MWGKFRGPPALLSGLAGRLMLYAGNNLDKVRLIFRAHHRPRLLGHREILASVCALRLAPLWDATHAFSLSKKSIFNLRVHAMQPLLRAVSSFPIAFHFCF